MSAMGDLVKAVSWDRYIATLFAPADKREALFSLYAFDAEVSRICDLVHDPLPGEIRLQWWRDVANGLRDGEAVGHPVASTLLQTIAAHDLPRGALDAYCEARIFEFYHDVMPDQTALEAHLGSTQSMMIQLAAMVLDRDAARKVSDAAGHAGVALGLVDILRRLPVIRQRGQGFVPQSILAAVGVSNEIFMGDVDAAAAVRVTGALSALAGDHWAKYQALASTVPKSVRPAFLPVACVPRVLRSVARQSDPARQMAPISPVLRMWDVMRLAIKG